ncbi:MAG: hypothetical protein HFH84_19090 [Lachnospiraceae bacterium]|nr:hypothetical protein [Lachnospiraceae bacterium]
MAIGLSVGDKYYSIGGSDFYHSFFSTISYYLEPDGWGTKYPVLTQDLYHGMLCWDKSKEARVNLSEIKDFLNIFPPNKVIWNIDDLSQRPPWGDNIAPDITNLSNYFVTNDGKDLFEVLDSAIEYSINKQIDIVVE